MKNIDSIIDKACFEYCEQVNSVYNEKDIFKAGANFALSKIPPIMIDIAVEKYKYQNRWRKVSEELPKVRDESYQILIRIPNIKSSATAWNIRNQSDCDIIAKMGNSEWKPIE